LQLRVDEELKIKLDRYAEFLDSTESYVVSEALKHVFSKDAEFKEWVERQNPEGRESKEPQYPATPATEKRADHTHHEAQWQTAIGLGFPIPKQLHFAGKKFAP